MANFGADPFDLNGKVAVVCGGSRGIGAAIARGLASRGARVVVASRKLENCEAVAQEIRELGGDASAAKCHVGSLEDIEALFAGVAANCGRLDVLVNNGATNPYFGAAVDTPDTALMKTLEVNVRGYLHCMSAAVKLMRESGGGAILNTASINAVRPADFQGIYSASKAAVVSLTKTFAKECGGDNIRVNALLPGLTRTRFAQTLFDDEKTLQDYLRATPLGRAAEPEDMVGAALYLVSDAAAFTTGACLVVDGGLTI